MTSTCFLVAGVEPMVLEGFAEFIAEDLDCQWSVRADGRRFELSFDCEIGFQAEKTRERVTKKVSHTKINGGCHFDAWQL